MIFTPRPYQGAMIRHLLDTPRANLYAGMGTGKTSSTLTAIAGLMALGEVTKVLVLAPLRVATSTWPDEVAKWDDFHHLKVAVACGDVTTRKAAIRSRADIVTMNYENVPWLIEYLDGDWPFDMVVADESTKLKNPSALRFKALRKTLGHPGRWVNLSGTPAPNGLLDLWSPQFLLDKGERLGRSFTSYKARWFKEDRFAHTCDPLPFAQEQIQEAIADTCLTIDAADHFDLPDLIENVIEIDLPPAARKIYADMEKEMFASINGQEVEAFNAAARTNKCLQLANGAIYYDDAGTWEEVHDAKLQALEDIIEEAAGMPVLVSYQFKSDLARIRQRIKFARILDQDPQTIRDWNAGKIPVLLAHPASAGHGLNLQDGSNILAYFSSGWNLEEDMQILERIGPTRQAQAGHKRPVFVHRIQARDTVDQLVMASRHSKKSVLEILLEAMK